MTIEEFKDEYLKEYTKFSKTGLFHAIISVIHHQSPICDSVNRTAGDLVVAGSVLFAEAKAHQGVINLLSDTLLSKETPEPPPEDYSEPAPM